MAGELDGQHNGLLRLQGKDQLYLVDDGRNEEKDYCMYSKITTFLSEIITLIQ